VRVDSASGHGQQSISGKGRGTVTVILFPKPFNAESIVDNAKLVESRLLVYNRKVC